jgi:hypothetical protein
MSDDLKERLSRLADRATEPGGDALERLHQRRARKGRTRRVGTIALALTVAVAGSWGAFAAFAGRDDRTAIGDESPSGAASWQPPEVLTVWPENPVRGPSPEDVQAAVDAGDESLTWRLDPKQVAERFARQFLAWSEVSAIERDIETSNAVRVFDVYPCAPDVACDLEGAPPAVHAVQPVTEGRGGIWSIAAVFAHDLSIELPAGGLALVIDGGSTIDLDLVLPDARRAHIGLVARNGCDEILEFDPGNGSGRHTIALPEPAAAADADPSCGALGAGFVFAYAQDDTTVPVGDPLLEPAAIEYPWLTIIPLYVEMIRDRAT